MNSLLYNLPHFYLKRVGKFSMGCVNSKYSDPEILESKQCKLYLSNIVSSAENWKIDWMSFTDALEKNQMKAAFWVEVTLL